MSDLSTVGEDELFSVNDTDAFLSKPKEDIDLFFLN